MAVSATTIWAADSEGPAGRQGGQGGLLADVAALLLRQQPADLEQVAEGLDRVGDVAEGGRRLDHAGLEHVGAPAEAGDHVVGRLGPLGGQPRLVGAQVVEQDGGLALADLQAGQAPQPGRGSGGWRPRP